MKKLSKLIALLLTALMVLAMVPMAALAEGAAYQANERKQLAKLDDAWKNIDAVEKDAASRKATPHEVTLAAYNAALNEPLVDKGSLVWESDIQFAFTIDGMHCLYYYTARAGVDANVRGEIAVDGFRASNAAGATDVLLVGPYYGVQSAFTDQYKEEALSIAEATGGTRTMLSGSAATGPAIVSNYLDKGVVIYDSHGTQSGTSSYLCLTTNTGITTEDYNNGWAVSSGSAAYIDGRYVQNHVTGQLSNCIVWMAICEGMKQDGNGTTGTALLAAGAGCVYGYSQSVTFNGDYEMEEVFWTDMKEGSTVADAFAHMVSEKCPNGCDPHGDAYPIVMSPVDSFPSNADSRQTVYCDWTLMGTDPVAIETFEFVNSAGEGISNVTVAMGKHASLKLVPTPSNANNFTVEWSSSDPTIATVEGRNKNATVTGISVGAATLTATVTTETKTVLTDSITINVTEAPKWNPTTTIVPEEEYLIGFEVGGNVYLAVNYNVSASNHYYNNISSTYYGYTAPAIMQGESVIGVSGNADDLTYCTWKFETASGGHIYSGYEEGRYLQVYTGTNYADLYPGTNNNYTWTYDGVNNTLYTYTTANRYAEYYSDGSLDMMGVTGSVPANSIIKLYSLSAEDPDPEATYYNVVFKDWDGTVLSSQRVKEGNDAAAPANPTRPLYVFTGWDVDFTNVQSDLIVTAQYEAYVAPEGFATVILTAGDLWSDGSGYQLLLDADASAYGTIIPETGALTSSGDASSEIYNQFEYKIPENADGSLTTSNIVNNNSVMITVPAGLYDYCITNPTPGDRVWIASNDGPNPGRGDDYEFLPDHTYIFTVSMYGEHDGVEITVIEGEAVFYTVTFIDWNGTVLKTQLVLEGNAATAPDNPTRPGYSFTGWDVDFSNVTDDLTVTATYAEKTNVWTPVDTIVPGEEYLIGFVVDGVVYLAAGQNDAGASYNSVNYTYYGYTAPATMNGENVIDVSGNVTDLEKCTWIFETGDFDGYRIKCAFDTSKYLVTWSSSSYDDLYTSTGTSFYWTYDASAHTLYRTVDGTNRYAQYISVEGSDQMCVTSSVPTNGYIQLYTESTVTPPEPTTYTVTFVDWDGTEISTQEVERGNAATAPADPIREGYTFTGWDVAFNNVQSDLTVTAQYEINTYTVTFVDWDGTEISTQEVEHGSAATAPEAPSREGYTFTGWDVDFTNVTGDLTVTAQYEQNAPSQYLKGDVNCDGIVDSADITLAAAYAMSAGSVSAQGVINGDMNGDGVLTAADLSALYSFIQG